MADHGVLAVRRAKSLQRARQHAEWIARQLKVQLPVQPTGRFRDAAHELTAWAGYVETSLAMIRARMDPTWEPPPSVEEEERELNQLIHTPGASQVRKAVLTDQERTSDKGGVVPQVDPEGSQVLEQEADDIQAKPKAMAAVKKKR